MSTRTGTRTRTKRPRGRPTRPGRGPLLLIGGHEDREGECRLLQEIAARARDGPLIIATLASEEPAELWQLYSRLFARLGVRDTVHLDVASREEALNGKAVEQAELFKKAGGVFFTGGSQLRITATLGGTSLCQVIRDLHGRGRIIAGTSAGASVMSSTMLVTGDSEHSPRLGDALRLAPGLGFVQDLLVDQHFAERGRIGRLVAAVAQNPATLGVGIDEDTAILVDRNDAFRVLGSGAVYVVDGTSITGSNVVEGKESGTLSVHGVRLHLLREGERYDVRARRPIPGD